MSQFKIKFQGDSGGPVQISNDHEVRCTYKQVGIVSFGAKSCGKVGFPGMYYYWNLINQALNHFLILKGIYVNVYNYIDWIEGIVWENEINVYGK